MDKKILASIVIIVIAIFVMIFAVSLSITANFGLQNDRVIVGVQTILTGENAVYGSYAQQGMNLAVSEINLNGGVNGKKIELIYEDDQANPTLAVNVIQKLLTQNPKAIVSFTGSGATLAVTPILEDNNVPTIVGLASNSKIKDAGDYIFRTIPSDSFQANQWVEFVEDKYSKPAILYVNNSWGKGLEETFLENYSGKVYVEEMQEGTNDVKSQLVKIKNYNPDVLIVPCYIRECVTTIKQMSELNIHLPIISGDNFYNKEILDAVDGKAEGVILTRPSEGSGKEWDSFKEKFIAKYNKEPNVIDAYAYDAMYTLYYALKDSDLTSEGIKNALYGVDFVGATGRNKFDSFGEVSKSFQWAIVRYGEFWDYN